MQSLPEVGPRVGDLSCPPRRGVVSARQLPHAPSARVFSSRLSACAASSAALPGVGGRQHGGYRTRLQRASSAPGTQLALHLQLLSQAARRCVFGGGGWLRSPFLLPVSRACACGGMTSNTDYRMALRCLSSRTRMLSRLVPCGKEDFTFTVRSIEFLIGAIGSQELSRFQICPRTISWARLGGPNFTQ